MIVSSSKDVLLTRAVNLDAIDMISEAWLYAATLLPIFLTGIWDERCWHQIAGIFHLIFRQKVQINILGSSFP